MESFRPREMPRSPTVAIVGATGAVGVELLRSLQWRRFPLRALRLYASPRSAGKRLSFDGGEIAVEALGEKSRLCGA